MAIEKILSCICVLVILMSVVPVSVFATGNSENTTEIMSRSNGTFFVESEELLDVVFEGTVTEVATGLNDWICEAKVDKVISGEYIFEGETVHITLSLLPCGTWDDVEEGDKIKVYGQSFPTYCLDCPLQVSVCGRSSYYLKKISSECLSISVWTDKSKYKIGETVTIYYQTNTACTAKLTVTKPDGTQVVVGGPNDIPVCTRSKSAAAGYPTGTRTVTFEAWTSAESKIATCYFDVVEEQKSGSLTVTIYPSEVRTDARWKLTSGPDTNWHSSGDTINNIPVGSYTIQFKDVSGWNKPSDKAVTITEGSHSQSGTYTPEEAKKVKFRGKIIADLPIISFYSFDVKIDKVLEDPTGNLQEGETVNVYGHRSGPAQVDDVTVGDEVEVFGEYRGYVGTYEQIFLSDYGDSSSDHYVKKIDGKKPKLCTSPDPPSHNFGTVPEDETRSWNFYITNCGDGTLTWSVSDDRSWITVYPTGGSTTTETDTIKVTIDTQGLSPGTHTGQVTVTSNDGTKKGTIIVNVPQPQPEPKLCTSPDPPSHNFGTVPEDETRSWNFYITNCGDGTLTWSVSDDRSWITVYPTGGSTTTETDTIKVTIDTQGLSPGTHTGQVTVTSNDGTKKGTIIVNVPQGSLEELKFNGTALEYYSLIAAWGWFVRVDEIISGPSELVGHTVKVYLTSINPDQYPSGFMDPNIKQGDSVGVYGWYQDYDILSLLGSEDYYINKIAPAQKPDLIVEDISWSPSSSEQGDTIISVTIKNQGLGSAGSSTAQAKISGTSHDFSVPALITDETHTETFTWLEKGCEEVAVRVIVDLNKDVPESNKRNNVRIGYLGINCPGADLLIKDLSWEPLNPKYGDIVTFNLVIKNQGLDSADSSAAVLIVFKANDEAFDKFFPVPALISGETFMQTFTWTANKCGYLEAIAQVGIDDFESIIDNNQRKEEMNIDCSNMPDLIIRDITLSHPNPKQEENIKFTVKTENKGSGTVKDFYVHYYIDSDYKGKSHVNSLSEGDTTSTDFSWTADKCGDFQVKAVADATGAVDERDETNNETVKSFSVVDDVKPTISITSPLNEQSFSTSPITVKGSASDNSKVTEIKVKVNDGVWQQASGTTSWSRKTVSLTEGKNTITAKATDDCGNDQSTSITVYYTSPDFTISISPASQSIVAGESTTYTITLKAEDGFKSAVALTVSGLSGGATASFNPEQITPQGKSTLIINTQATTPEGQPTITVTGTGGGKTREATAKLIISSKPKPDLKVEDIRWDPENPEYMGDPVDIHITIKNVGLGAADNYPIYVDFIFCGNYFQRKKIESGLKSGDTATVTYEGMSASPCELTAIVDPFDGIKESDEKNNERKETMNIYNIDGDFGNIHSEPRGTCKQGDIVRPHVWVKNTGDVTHDFFVSMYIENWYHPKYNYEIVDSIIVDPGQEKEVILNWDVSKSGAPAGTYKVYFILWKSRVNGELEGELDAEVFDMFQIEGKKEKNYKNFAEAARYRAAAMDTMWVYYNATGDNEKLIKDVNKIIDDKVAEGFDVFIESIQQGPKSGNPLIDGCLELVDLLSTSGQAAAGETPYERMTNIIEEMGDLTVAKVDTNGAARCLRHADIVGHHPDGRCYGQHTHPCRCDLKNFIDECDKEALAWENKDMEDVKSALEKEASLLGRMNAKIELVTMCDYYEDYLCTLKEITSTSERGQIIHLYSEAGGKTEDILREWKEGYAAGEAQVTCPVNLHAYDSLGRHVGVNESGGVDLEIPGAYYSGIDSHPQIIQIFGTTDYYFVVEALAQGEFNLTTESHTYEETTTVHYEHVAIENDTKAIIDHSKEGYSIDIDKDGDNINDYTVDPTTVETNHPPEVSIMAIADDVIFKDDISISYTLKDIDTDICNISARYSTDQMIWHDATMGSGGDGTIGLTSSADGVTHTYVWASGVDLPDISSVVYFEIRPNDGMTDGIHGISNAFYVGEVTASFTYSPLNPSVNEHIVFAAYASIGNITNYTWDFDDGTITSTDAPIIMHSYDSAGEYSIILTVTDKHGASNTINKPITVCLLGQDNYSLQLHTGWNLISLSIMPDDTDVLDVMNSLAGNWNSVWSYETGNWKRYDLTGPDFLNDLTTIEPGKGYWLNMKSEDTLSVSGSEPTTKSISLSAGWNLVGYNSLNSKSTTSAMNSVTGNWNSVWSYETGNWKRYDLIGPDFLNDLTTMEPGKGYWIDMKSSDTWTLGA